MREILFRGKRTDNGEWVEGDIHKNREFSKAHIHPNGERVRSFAVLPETVGQFTGLFDKNGAKIFEGDILTLENEGIYAAIKYNENKAAFYVEDEDREDYLGEAWETNVIIIGNIHDNPNMLSGGEENG